MSSTKAASLNRLRRRSRAAHPSYAVAKIAGVKLRFLWCAWPSWNTEEEPAAFGWAGSPEVAEREARNRAQSLSDCWRPAALKDEEARRHLPAIRRFEESRRKGARR